ncbi:melanoregulin-like, partial [Acanthaster planci]|uniref:Melanoregulin-like n=1 Tax=Acanthaster planci TaxID=133434 RepID=A0A8B7XX15_ACAPL
RNYGGQETRVTCIPRNDDSASSDCGSLKRDNNYDGLDEPNKEDSPLVRNGGDALVDGVIASRRSATDDLNLWTNPDDVNHVISEDDRQLSELLDRRRKAFSREEETLLHGKIEEIRKVRKKVQDRWKRVLSELGFVDEQNKLVAVSSVTRTASPNTSVRAYNLHDKLVRETSIFGDAPTQRHRYAVILDRLLDLDIADDFFEAAHELYPKRAEKPNRHHKRAPHKKQSGDGPGENGDEINGQIPASPGPVITANGHKTPTMEQRAATPITTELVVAEVHEEPK